MSWLHLKLSNKQSRILAIMRKEFLHIIHDPRTLAIVFLMPVIQLLIFGYALNMEIQKITLAVLNHDHSLRSRQLIEQFRGSDFFELFHYDNSLEDAENLLLSRQVRAIMVIPHDFAQKSNRQKKAAIQLIIDASDPNAALNVQNYCQQIIASFNRDYGVQITEPFQLNTHLKFNPDIKSSYFFVPGLLALILVMISALLTSITISREKEQGTMEQILVSPVSAPEIIAGKVIPYIFLAFLDGALILLISILVFKVPFTGSILLLSALTLVYVITALSLGLMISTISSTQQAAMMLAVTLTLLPTIMLSGFIFPLASMPEVLQAISYLVPARYYLIMVRGIMLKGNHLGHLMFQTFCLSAMAFILLIVSWKKFNLNLDK